MRHRAKLPLMGLTLLTAVWGCQDSPPPALTAPDGPAFAKGGNGKGGPQPPPGGVGIVALGEFIFQDENLSVNHNQSCQTCHEPSEGFAAPLPGVVTEGSVVQGSQPGEFGDRKPPSAAFVTLAPLFSASGNNASGGTFWDGRAGGDITGSPAIEQAMGPFLNPKEQALPDEACVVYLVAMSEYGADFDAEFGGGIQAHYNYDGGGDAFMDSYCRTFGGEALGLPAAEREWVHTQYVNVATAVAAFEATFNVFDSPFDQGTLTDLEADGAKLFGSKGKCQQCHDDKGSQPLFTDFEYHNLGVPRNPANHLYGTGPEFDPGLGGVTGNPAHLGKFKTPTVRNVAAGNNRTYMHNGALVSLRQVVQFYNTRDVLPVCDATVADPNDWGPDGVGCWPAPEYPENLDTRNMGNLGLTDAEVDAIVAFMEALNSSNVAGGTGG